MDVRGLGVVARQLVAWLTTLGASLRNFSRRVGQVVATASVAHKVAAGAVTVQVLGDEITALAHEVGSTTHTQCGDRNIGALVVLTLKVVLSAVRVRSVGMAVRRTHVKSDLVRRTPVDVVLEVVRAGRTSVIEVTLLTTSSVP